MAGLLLLSLGLSLGLAQGPFTQTRVTTASQAGRDSALPSLSADGTKIAFESDSNFLGQSIVQDEIWLYDTATMTFTRVTTNSPISRSSRFAHLSGDGTKIAFESDSDFLGQGIPADQEEIWLYDTATMTVTRITTTSPAGFLGGCCNLNADGTKVAFSSHWDFLLGQDIPTIDQAEIWLYDTATMTFTRITTASPAGRRSHRPSLSTDGSKIAFWSDSDFLGQGIPAFQTEIWLYDTATMTVTRVTTASSAGRDSTSPSLSADGTKIAFQSDSDFLGQGIPDFQTEIWLYDTATMTVTRVTTASSAGRNSQLPSLSADGTKVAFLSDSDFLGQGIPDDQDEIWLYDTATMTVTRVTTASHAGRDSWTPSLSADGSKVAFWSTSDFLGQGIPADQWEIWLFEAQAVLNLTKTVDDNNPEPGQGITYTVVVGNSGLISATNLTISDTTPLSLTFINGSTTITPFGNGTTGDAPTLVNGLTLTAGEQVTVT